MAATRRSRCGCGAKRGCAWSRAAISRAIRPTAAIRARATSASRWCRTRRRPRKHCTGWSACWAEGDIMSAIDGTLDSLTFLTDEARDALRGRLRQLVGPALILFALLLAIALAIWSVRDPSLSHATTTAVRNLLGIAGSTVADLSMQIFGLAALTVMLPIGIWGWRLASDRPLRRERVRLLIWIVAIALTAGFAATLPRPSSWPLPVGLGGVVGDAILRGAAWLAGGSLNGLTYVVIGATSSALGFVAFAIACGFGLHGAEDETEEADDEPEADDSAKEAEEKEGRAAI